MRRHIHHSPSVVRVAREFPPYQTQLGRFSSFDRGYGYKDRLVEKIIIFRVAKLQSLSF